MKWRKLTLFACVGALGFTFSIWASISSSKLTQPPQPINQISVQLQQQAQAITVKVMSQNFLGSGIILKKPGIILKKQGSVYTVVTNAHVLRAGEPPYRIQTADGRIWSASIPKTNHFGNNDLAVLQFHSPSTVYPVASLGSSPVVGDEVFAAGFPMTEKPSGEQGFVLTTGKVSLMLPKALEGGYQIGYTNDIEKGMSGGALLNSRGEVVGVNGMQAYPLWDVPSVFADGSEADRALHQKIIRLSWAVPIETILQELGRGKDSY